MSIHSCIIQQLLFSLYNRFQEIHSLGSLERLSNISKGKLSFSVSINDSNSAVKYTLINYTLMKPKKNSHKTQSHDLSKAEINKHFYFGEVSTSNLNSIETEIKLTF